MKKICSIKVYLLIKKMRHDQKINSPFHWISFLNSTYIFISYHLYIHMLSKAKINIKKSSLLLTFFTKKISSLLSEKNVHGFLIFFILTTHHERRVQCFPQFWQSAFHSYCRKSKRRHYPVFSGHVLSNLSR